MTPWGRRLWGRVSDTTEFVIGEGGKLYLAAVLDLFSRFVVGWAISAVNDRRLTLKALEMAVQRRCPDPVRPGAGIARALTLRKSVFSSHLPRLRLGCVDLPSDDTFCTPDVRNHSILWGF